MKKPKNPEQIARPPIDDLVVMELSTLFAEPVTQLRISPATFDEEISALNAAFGRVAKQGNAIVGARRAKAA